MSRTIECKSEKIQDVSLANYPGQCTFVYDFDSNEDDLSSSSFASRQPSGRSNFTKEKDPTGDSKSIGIKSIASVIRF